MRLEPNAFQRVGAMEAQIIDGEDRFQPLRNFDIDAHVVDKNSRIDKVGLAFDLAAAQRRQNAVGLHQADSSLGQADAVAIPKRKLTAHEIWIVKDSVKSSRLAVSRILVALRPKK